MFTAEIMSGAFDLSSLLAPITKRKIFVSYQHSHDQAFYNALCQRICDTFDLVQDNSVDRLIDSDNSEYVMRHIRENYITGSSCTIVLCGPETRWRKFVDWEIKATLDKEHGLLAIRLTNAPLDQYGRWNKPDRLQDSLDSGYAAWTTWENIWRHPDVLTQWIGYANQRPKFLIANARPTLSRNGTPPWHT
jgi:MTH538 TIR-like domain (DUF1863)